MPLTIFLPSRRHFSVGTQPARVRDLVSGNGDRADDLVQETLLRAIANIDSLQPGSNLPAWRLILRNLFRSDYRKRRREVEDAEGNYAKTLKTQPAQNAHLEFEEFRHCARQAAAGPARSVHPGPRLRLLRDEDAAAICGCAVGTIKSASTRTLEIVRAALCRWRRGFWTR